MLYLLTKYDQFALITSIPEQHALAFLTVTTIINPIQYNTGSKCSSGYNPPLALWVGLPFTVLEEFIALEELPVTGLFPESHCDFYVSMYTTLSSFTIMTCYATRICSYTIVH